MINFNDIIWEDVFKKGISDYKESFGPNSNLLKFNDLCKPEIGNLVFETSYKIEGFGFLLASDYNKGDVLYYIASPLTKKLIIWHNCNFVKIDGYNFYKYEKLFEENITPILKKNSRKP